MTHHHDHDNPHADVLVGYATDRHPVLAEVICLPCWHALPAWREVYPCQVPYTAAHLAVCAHCGEEPGSPEAGESQPQRGGQQS